MFIVTEYAALTSDSYTLTGAWIYEYLLLCQMFRDLL